MYFNVSITRKNAFRSVAAKIYDEKGSKANDFTQASVPIYGWYNQTVANFGRIIYFLNQKFSIKLQYCHISVIFCFNSN